jgi:molybdenum cofactor cytidylyltransferase
MTVPRALAWLVIAPIVLAGGESRRMGTPKALLPDGAGRLFVTRVLHTLSAAGFHSVTLVTGRLHGDIVRVVSQDAPRGMAVTLARNPDPTRGQLSSLLIGLEAAAKPGTQAALVTLVDVPFVLVETVEAVVRAYESSRAPIVRPARGTTHGHPVMFDASLFPELRRVDPAYGAKAVVHAHEAEILNVDTADDGAFIDVDTREDYQRTVIGRS